MSAWDLEPAVLTVYHSLPQHANNGKTIRFVAKILSEQSNGLIFNLQCPDPECDGSTNPTSTTTTTTKLQPRCSKTPHTATSIGLEALISHAAVNGTLCAGDMVEIIGTVDKHEHEKGEGHERLVCEVHIIRNVNGLDYSAYVESISVLLNL